MMIFSGLVLFSMGWWAGLQLWQAERIYDIETVTPQRVAIVLGAGVYPNGRLSNILRARMDAAIKLYEDGKVDKLLLSGSNPSASHNEPGSMMNYAIARGVPAEDLQPDFAGRRTYDTCYRARNIFQVDEAIIVTQSFHLPRALFLCNQLGIEAIGVSADPFVRNRSALRYNTAREIPASFLALFDIVWQAPAPIMGEPIPIE